jgi:methionyl-tRNA formyltransferase
MAGPRLKLSFLTTDDPLYLPAFYDRVLAQRGRDVQAVYVVPPLYKKQSPADAALRYARTFGASAAAQLAARVIAAKLRGSSIAATCARWNVRCEDVVNVNAPEFLERLRAEEPDVLISVSTPQVFSRPLIDLPRLGILNIHGAVLPLYRGVMPSFWMMANGERQAGVTVYFVDEKIDSGERVGLRVFDIDPGESLDQFLRRSKAVAADLLLEVLDGLEAGSLERSHIELSEGSYFSWPDPAAVRRFREAGRRLW